MQTINMARYICDVIHRANVDYIPSQFHYSISYEQLAYFIPSYPIIFQVAYILYTTFQTYV